MKRVIGVRALLVMLVLVGAVIPARAQDGGSGCAPEVIEQGMTAAWALHERVAKALDEGDLTAAQEAADRLTQHLAGFYDTCGDINAASDPPVTAVDPCLAYPTYCVPHFASGMSMPSEGVPGVVRGIGTDDFPFIGDPAAPVQFRVVSAPACSHCWHYFFDSVRPFIADEVLQGRAVLSYAMLTTIGGPHSELSAAGAMCAGRQGAFWEMLDAQWMVVDEHGPAEGFTAQAIEQQARELGLDLAAFNECLQSAWAADVLAQHHQFSSDQGVSGTPTLLVRYGDDEAWTKLEHSARGYASMVEMTVAAHEAASK